MRFWKNEQGQPEIPEPYPLHVALDPEAAARYAELAEGRSVDGIYDLWKHPDTTNPTIRQRALATLTAPHGQPLPYPHTDQSLGRVLHIREEVGGQPTSSLRLRLADRPELAHEFSRGILYWLDATGGHVEGDVIDSRYDYQTAIHQLLPLVDEATADRLFVHYSINDIQPYWNMDGSSGYNPLMHLLYDREIPEKYKKMALESWRAIATQEEQGEAQPREEHERATTKMTELLQTWVHGDVVDEATHTAIVRFLEGCTLAGQPYIQDFIVSRVGRYIADKNVRFSFAWRHVLGEAAQFTIRTEEDRAFVEWAGAAARERGLAFAGRADALVREYETNQRNN